MLIISSQNKLEEGIIVRDCWLFLILQRTDFVLPACILGTDTHGLMKKKLPGAWLGDMYFGDIKIPMLPILGQNTQIKPLQQR